MKTPEISVRLQVPLHREAQHAGGLRPRQPGHRDRQEPRACSGTGEPESEPSRDSRRSSSETPASWPNVASNPWTICRFRSDNIRRELHSLQSKILRQFGSRVILAQSTGDNEKRVLRSIDFETASPVAQQGLRKATEKEWEKFLRFGAVVVIEEAEKDALLKQGHVMIPSKWVHVDKNEFKKHAPDYQPKWKSRLVSRRNFERTEGIRSGSPTGDSDLHLARPSVVGTKLHSAEVSNAYFQSEPLDRVLLLRQPRGGLPQVDPSAALLVRVPVRGLTDSGRWCHPMPRKQDLRQASSSILHFLQSRQ